MLSVVCVRCATTVRQGDPDEPGMSHTFCLRCLPDIYPYPVESIPDMDQEELDALPWGVIRLDAKNRVIAYNAFEAKLAHRRRKDVLGRDFFRDVAPCMNVGKLAGWVAEAISQRASVNKITSFVLDFPHGRVFVKTALAYDAPSRTTTIAVDPRTQEPPPAP